MALSIQNPETERLARELSRLTGEPVAAAVDAAVRERLSRVAQDKLAKRVNDPRLAAELNEIVERSRSFPDVDTRRADEILGYNEFGRFD